MSYNTDLDFNNAEIQNSGDFDVIPEDTVVTLIMNLRPGSTGEGGWLKQGKPSASSSTGWQMLDFEFTVLGGEFDKRRLWEHWMWHNPGPSDAEKSITTANITKQKIRAVLESARGVIPTDESDGAKKARSIDSFADLIPLTFMAKLKIEPGQNGYGPKNGIKMIITPGMDGYINPAGPSSGATSLGAAAATVVAGAQAAQTQSGAVPSWAK